MADAFTKSEPMAAMLGRAETDPGGKLQVNLGNAPPRRLTIRARMEQINSDLESLKAEVAERNRRIAAEIETLMGEWNALTTEVAIRIGADTKK